MLRYTKEFFVVVAMCSVVALNAVAHSGGTNSAGCHNNRKTGGYHCHNPKPSYISSPGSRYGGIPVEKTSDTNTGDGYRYLSDAAKVACQDSTLITEIQQRLNHVGYLVGPEDGKCGKKTRNAIRGFQHKCGTRAHCDVHLIVDGEPSVRLLQLLNAWIRRLPEE